MILGSLGLIQISIIVYQQQIIFVDREMLRSLTLYRKFFSSSSKFDFSKDYYKILNLEPNCTKASIRNSYLTLAKKYHPDLNPQGKQTFTNIHQAYQVLSNQNTRKEYDSSNNIHHYDAHHRTRSQDQNFKSKFYQQQNRQQSPRKHKKRSNSQQKWASSQIDWEELGKRREEWKRQFYEFYGTQQDPRSSQKPKKQRSQEDEEFLKTQKIFSDRNPFWNPSHTQEILAGLRKKRESEARKDLGIDQYLSKLKNKFWK